MVNMTVGVRSNGSENPARIPIRCQSCLRAASGPLEFGRWLLLVGSAHTLPIRCCLQGSQLVASAVRAWPVAWRAWGGRPGLDWKAGLERAGSGRGPRAGPSHSGVGPWRGRLGQDIYDLP